VCACVCVWCTRRRRPTAGCVRRRRGVRRRQRPDSTAGSRAAQRRSSAEGIEGRSTCVGGWCEYGSGCGVVGGWVGGWVGGCSGWVGVAHGERHVCVGVWAGVGVGVWALAGGCAHRRNADAVHIVHMQTMQSVSAPCEHRQCVGALSLEVCELI
jgi:hypothetical protein